MQNPLNLLQKKVLHISILITILSSVNLQAQCIDQSPNGDCDDDSVLNVNDFDNDNNRILNIEESNEALF